MRARLKIKEAEREAQAEVESVLGELPEEIRQALKPVSVIVRPARNKEERELLGLFSGVTHGDGIPADPEHAPKITLFVDTLLDYAEGNPEVFLQECRITLLHEIGHYLGWDEEEVESRGL